MPLERKKTLNVFRDAAEAWGSYDDFPVGQPGTDPMPHLSRNRIAQPFYLVSEADQVLVQMAGTGEIWFRDIEPARLLLEPGDTVYIPACVPSRLVPHGENVQIRLKAEPAVREAVAWYCACGAAQPRFPAELMGWRRYVQYVELANRARRDMEAAWTPGA